MKLAAILLFLALTIPRSIYGGEFTVAPSGRHLLLANEPFFWLGDTVWLLAQVPSRPEVDSYLEVRRKQGFTVIQLTAVMSEERVWGTLRENAFGDTPFIRGDPGQSAVTPGNNPENPEEYDYWDHLEFVLQRVHAHGMRAALVTMFVGSGGDGFKYLNRTNAPRYGRFLGERFRSLPQIIWVLGGDNTPDTPDKQEIWNSVARSITEAICGSEDYSQTLMTYHINGGRSSSEWWHDSPWLDFNMAQTWSDYGDIYSKVQRDYQKTPTKPCGLGEGAYEDGPQYPTGPINALVIRKQAYWSYFSGGYHTYGNGNVWHFDTFKPELTQPWKEALNSPGARDFAVLRKFFGAVDWFRLIPDQGLLPDSEANGADLNCAMRSVERDLFVFYLSGKAPVRIALDLPNGRSPSSARWLNPHTGEERPANPLTGRITDVSVPAGWTDALLQVQRSSGFR